MRGRTATLDELEIHATTLNPGQTSHAPHKHPNEELVILASGKLEAMSNGNTRQLGPGSVIFNASNQLHSVRNVGDVPATYHVINWTSSGRARSDTSSMKASP
jgi:quercetin dioxygenase-like cupin family protein